MTKFIMVEKSVSNNDFMDSRFRTWDLAFSPLW